MIQPTKIMTHLEQIIIMNDLSRRAKTNTNAWQNCAIFRMSCCCGMRASEIAGCNIEFLNLNPTVPVIALPKGVAKGGKKRTIQLAGNLGTIKDLREWRSKRLLQGAEPGDPFICVQRGKTFGTRLDKDDLYGRWKTMMKCLGPERAAQLHTHCGRHTYATSTLSRPDLGYHLVRVMSDLGHQSIEMTSQYLHLIPAEPSDKDVFDIGTLAIPKTIPKQKGRPNGDF